MHVLPQLDSLAYGSPPGSNLGAALEREGRILVIPIDEILKGYGYPVVSKRSEARTNITIFADVRCRP